MHLFVPLILVTLLSCSTSRPPEVGPRPVKRALIKSKPSADNYLRVLARKTIPRKGTFSTVSDGDVTTERWRRQKSESVFILENGELRTETENMENGPVLTRTWQDGVMTTLLFKGTTRTSLVVFDRDGNFIQKIVTEKDKFEPHCYQYENKRTFMMDAESCMELIPALE